MRCATCGYFRELHDEDTLKCPLCACSMVAAEHLVVAVPAAPLRSWEGKQVLVCPGKPRTAAGKLPTLRRGGLKAPSAVAVQYEYRPGWGSILFPVIEQEVEEDEPQVALPPQVPARPPQGPGELASYQGKQAVGLGRRGVAAGWQVEAFYARAGDGHEICGLRLKYGVYRAVATWTRKAGNIGKLSGWATDVAYAWQLDVKRGPIKLTHTDLEGIFNVQ
jgi:hypothetical protein